MALSYRVEVWVMNAPSLRVLSAAREPPAAEGMFVAPGRAPASNLLCGHEEGSGVHDRERPDVAASVNA